MAKRCIHEPLRGIISADGLSTGWAWCRSCGAIFRRSELPPPVWDQDKPFSRIWHSDEDRSIWWTGPTEPGPFFPAWCCAHSVTLPLTGAHIGDTWRWCERCGAVAQTLVGPVQRWHSNAFVEEIQHDGKHVGIFHHPWSHGARPDLSKPFDVGPPLYGAPGA